MSFANDDVLQFYKELPFNIFGDIAEHQKNILSGVSLNTHAVLLDILATDKSVLEVGCGVGWLSAQIADRFKSSVTSIDFNQVAIDTAEKAASSLGLQVKYQVADLFLYEPEDKFDICISLGVLHHTDNCHAAIQRCVENYVKPGGYFYVGLYHLYGRRPFLDHFVKLSADGATESELLKEYARLRRINSDQTHLYSWFRDQVLHPHETQHTLQETVELCSKLGAKLVSTSINQFKNFGSHQELFEKELEYEQVSKSWIEQGKYFPGFFTALFQKN